jgi:hypothetical protein
MSRPLVVPDLLVLRSTVLRLAAAPQPVAAEPAELDAVIAALKRTALVKSATWTVETEG